MKQYRPAKWDIVEEEELAWYTLDQGRAPLLPEGAILELNGATQVMGLLCENRTLVQVIYRGSELALLKHCLDAYPEYCPHATLLAVCLGISRKSAAFDIEHAREQGRLQVTMKPVRDAMAKLRPRLARFGLDVQAISSVGYIILPHRTDHWSPKNSQENTASV
jgi:hypothetical protein